MKKQTRKVGVAGGFINQMMGNNQTLPEIGKGMTELMYSDRYAYEVLEVAPDCSWCIVDRYNAKRIDNNGMSESQDYEYKELEGSPRKLTWRNKKGGCWCWETKEVRVIPKIAREIMELSDNYFQEDQIKDVYGEEVYNHIYRIGAPEFEGTYYLGLRHYEGITKEYTNYTPVSVIFGVKERYYDFTF